MRGGNCLSFAISWMHLLFLVGSMLLIFLVFCVLFCLSFVLFLCFLMFIHKIVMYINCFCTFLGRNIFKWITEKWNDS